MQKNHCLISNYENLVAKIQSVKFSFLLSIFSNKNKFFLTIVDTRRLCEQCRSRSDCADMENRSLIYNIFSFILGYN